MAIAHLDILMRQEDGSFIWLEAVHDLHTAKVRLQQLSSANPGEYFVFDQRTQKVVANVGANAATSS